MYFRFYGPEKGYYDKSWQLEDVERLDEKLVGNMTSFLDKSWALPDIKK